MRVPHDTDKNWEQFGRQDPYYGVITHDNYRQENLSAERRHEFFESGIAHMEAVLSTVRRRLDAEFTVKRALYFGCGVGRLLIPLARIAEEVTGVDVSDAMLEEARKNCAAQSVQNVLLVKSDDALSLLDGTYDFIHLFIVFQHIPVQRGERIFAQLLRRLAPGGVGVIHFKYGQEVKNRKWSVGMDRHVPWGGNLLNLSKGRKWSAARMQMFSYDLNILFALLQKAGITEFFTTFENHGGNLGVMLYFQRTS
ncbi:MAG: methyltransferase domain-containing protein [Acidithiobacillus sp.]